MPYSSIWMNSWSLPKNWGKPITWKIGTKAERWKWYREEENLKETNSLRRPKEAIVFAKPELEIIRCIIEQNWAPNLKYRAA